MRNPLLDLNYWLMHQIPFRNWEREAERCCMSNLSTNPVSWEVAKTHAHWCFSLSYLWSPSTWIQVCEWLFFASSSVKWLSRVLVVFIRILYRDVFVRSQLRVRNPLSKWKFFCHLPSWHSEHSIFGGHIALFQSSNSIVKRTPTFPGLSVDSWASNTTWEFTAPGQWKFFVVTVLKKSFTIIPICHWLFRISSKLRSNMMTTFDILRCLFVIHLITSIPSEVSAIERTLNLNQLAYLPFKSDKRIRSSPSFPRYHSFVNSYPVPGQVRFSSVKPSSPQITLPDVLHRRKRSSSSNTSNFGRRAPEDVCKSVSDWVMKVRNYMIHFDNCCPSPSGSGATQQMFTKSICSCFLLIPCFP